MQTKINELNVNQLQFGRYLCGISSVCMKTSWNYESDIDEAQTSQVRRAYAKARCTLAVFVVHGMGDHIFLQRHTHIQLNSANAR